jgi:hypothetical protein
VGVIQRRTKETLRFIGSGLVCLVDDDDISDLKQAGLDRLHAVTKPRGLNDDHRIGKRRDIGAVLTRTDCFYENHWVAGSVQQVHEPGSRPGKTTLATATCHAPDKDTIVRMAIHHANAIAENRAAGNRTRRVNGEYGYATTRRPDLAEKCGHERTFPGSGWPGHADYVCAPGQRKEGIERLKAARLFVFHKRRQTWQCSPVRPLNANEQLLGGYHNGVCRGALSRM